MYDPATNEFKPIPEDAVKDAKEPVFRVGQEITLNGLVFIVYAIKRKKLILKVIRKVGRNGDS